MIDEWYDVKVTQIGIGDVPSQFGCLVCGVVW